MGKHKLPNTVEKCDEWLSTRTKSKIHTPKQTVKRASLSKPLRNIGNIILTQTSPPPRELQTHTKQSTLSNYFTKSKNLTDVSNIDDEQFESSDELPTFEQNPPNEQYKENQLNIDSSVSQIERDDVEKTFVDYRYIDHHMDADGDGQHSSDELPHLVHHRNSHSKKPRTICKGRSELTLYSNEGDSNMMDIRGDNYQHSDMDLPPLTWKNRKHIKKFTNKIYSLLEKSKDHPNFIEESRLSKNEDIEESRLSQNKDIEESSQSQKKDNDKSCESFQNTKFDTNIMMEKRKGQSGCLKNKNIASCNIGNLTEVDGASYSNPCKGKMTEVKSQPYKHIVTDLVDSVNFDFDLMTEITEPVKVKRSEVVSSLNSEFGLMTELSDQVQNIESVEQLTCLDTNLDLMSEVAEPVKKDKRLETIPSFNSDLDLMSEVTEPVKRDKRLETIPSFNSDLDLMSEVTEPVKTDKRLETIPSFNSDLDLMSEVTEPVKRDNRLETISSFNSDLDLMSEVPKPVKKDNRLGTVSSFNSDLDLMSEVPEPVKKDNRLGTVSSFSSDLDMMSEVSGIENKGKLIGSQEADLELENFSLENDSQFYPQ